MRLRAPDVAISHRLRRPPYGGSNQFLLALRGELERRGLRVSHGRLPRRARAVLLHAYLVEGVPPAGARVVHRVDGPIRLYRGTDDGADARIEELNRTYADATIFQSQYSLAAHRELGIDLREPVVIPNAVDPAIFFPAEREPPRRRLKLIATSWSDNPRKGAGALERIARRLDPARFELTFVGRTAVDLGPARVVPPRGSREVAALLRAHDAYVAASLNDPCSNALLEALACGLPALYARSGGHPELVGDGGLGFDDPVEAPELASRLAEEWSELRERISVVPLREVADRYLAALGLG
ncbi:MAG TPA: glycosyltransferase family 4 protein [Gaiellaceae bacterium]